MMLDADYATAVTTGATNHIGFEFTADQLAWKTVAAEVAASAETHAVNVDSTATFPRLSVAAAWDKKLAAMPAQVSDGGGGADALAVVLAIEEVAQACGSTAMVLHMHLAALQLLVRSAQTKTDQARIATLIANRHLCTYATSEFGSGSRWWHMDSVAERLGERWRLQAQKSWATSAGRADQYIVPLRAGPHASPNELTLFMVPAGKGIEPVGEWEGSGLRGNSSTPLNIDAVVDDCSRVGPSGFGFELLLAYGLPSFQLGLGAVYLGIAQAAYDAAAMHAVTRRYADVGGTKSEGETTQRRLAEMRLRIDQSRAFTYVVADKVRRFDSDGIDFADLDSDVGFLTSLAGAKIGACETAAKVTDEAMKICGGSAFKRGHVVERCYRDARAGSIMGPDDDSLKLLIGQRLTGKPYPWT